MSNTSAQYFDEAVKYVQGLPKSSSEDPTTAEQKLAFYALFKQGTEGPLSDGKSRPGMLDIQGQYKFDAWKSIGDMDKELAKGMYADLVACSIIVGSITSAFQRQFYERMMEDESSVCGKFLRMVLHGQDVKEKPEIWSLAEEFGQAALQAQNADLSPELKTELEGLYMQGLYGDVYIGRPSMLGSLAKRY
eukprot:TRINITY_DN19669_c0_g2_i1.p1 TRINITY_DN19669_c0_g2~~TRINITY_DN19669_c0_g2_i1.p1  ORF type:complete len:191 (-),score=19.07 TRINITY_DN19669_c0_g2_i1:61-633(-)